MKDFHRWKMSLRVTMAKELWRRGVPLEEIARLCRPSEEEIKAYKDECANTIREEVRATKYIEIAPISPNTDKKTGKAPIFFMLATTAILWVIILLVMM